MLKRYNIKLSILFVLTSGFLLNGCSWVEQFMIKNNTTEAIDVTYELTSSEKGFSLFYNHPELFGLTSKKGIDWEKKKEVEDADTSRYKIHVQLPPNHALIIGSLHNQKYESYDQEFFNDRHFNLKHLTVKTTDELIDITPDKFDTYFYKERGEIILLVE